MTRAAIIYLLAITVAEVVTTFFAPVLGMIGHIVIVVVLMMHSALASGHPHRELLLSLCLVPLVRIISLSMPLGNIPQIWWYLVIYAPLLAASIVIMRALGYSAEQIGLSFKRLRIQMLVMFTGLGFGVAEYLILTPEPLLVDPAWHDVLVPALILLVSTGFTEEFMFRGVLQRSAMGAFGWWGIIYVSLLFAVLHMGFNSWLDVVFVFGVALFFGFVVKRTGSLIGVTLSHGITNIMLLLIMPLFF
ncbi:lysostaphin resistance A-like protein [Chloroflexota bacterium]